MASMARPFEVMSNKELLGVIEHAREILYQRSLLGQIDDPQLKPEACSALAVITEATARLRSKSLPGAEITAVIDVPANIKPPTNRIRQLAKALATLADEIDSGHESQFGRATLDGPAGLNQAQLLCGEYIGWQYCEAWRRHVAAKQQGQ